MVSTRSPTSKSSSPFSNPLVTVPNAPITIGIIITCMFHSFFNSLSRSRYLSFFSHSFSFILWSARTANSTILQVLFFLLIIIRSGLLAEIKWSVCMSKSHHYYYYFYKPLKVLPTYFFSEKFNFVSFCSGLYLFSRVGLCSLLQHHTVALMLILWIFRW